MPLRVTVAAFLFLALAAAVPADAQTFEIPASWAGIWDMNYTDKDCDTGEVIDTYASTDTLCTGQSIGPGGELGLECTGSVSDAEIDFTCSSTQEIIAGCTLTITYTVQGTRDGDSLSGTERFSWVYTGDCGPIPDQCEDTEFTGTRIAAEPPTCAATPVAETTWGTIKSLYRN